MTQFTEIIDFFVCSLSVKGLGKEVIINYLVAVWDGIIPMKWSGIYHKEYLPRMSEQLHSIKFSLIPASSPLLGG